MISRFLTVVFFLVAVNTYSQNCGDVFLDSQAQVNDFVANNNASCNEINTLSIGESNLDLSALTFITAIDKIEINAGMSANDITVTSFLGLENVTSLNEIYINAYNPYEANINSFQGLESITSIENINISGDSDALVIGSFQGLNNVTSITDFYINSSGSATSGSFNRKVVTCPDN